MQCINFDGGEQRIIRMREIGGGGQACCLRRPSAWASGNTESDLRPMLSFKFGALKDPAATIIMPLNVSI